jgi:valyl-tRNA synthetase
VLNASRFVLGLGDPAADAAPSAPLDLALLARLSDVIAEATTAFEEYEYTRALERIEAFFWAFCDDYLELVKSRAYAGDGSALATLQTTLSTILRLFAPFLPYATEEVWSWWQQGSVHRSTWPTPDEVPGGGDPAVLEVASAILGELRKAKTEAKRSMKTVITRAAVVDKGERVAAARGVESDLRDAGNVAELTFAEGDELEVTVELEPAAP